MPSKSQILRLAFLLFFALVSSSLVLAQNKKEKPPKEKPVDGWITKGSIALLFNQSAFNDQWQGGGTSNVAGNITGNYTINYKKRKFTWGVKFFADFGLTKGKDQEFYRKTSDRMEFNSIIGSQIDSTQWYYSALVNFRSQFASGYEFFERELKDNQGNITGIEEARTEITDLFSPAYLQVGPGVLWKADDNFKINIAPATARFIFVDRKFTEVDPSNEAAITAYQPYFGVEANKTLRFELGASLSAYFKFDIMENISLENDVNFYSDYLENPENIDIDYTLNLAMLVNKYVTANFIFQTIYDDNASRGFQVRETLGLGFKYMM